MIGHLEEFTVIAAQKRFVENICHFNAIIISVFKNADYERVHRLKKTHLVSRFRGWYHYCLINVVK